MPYSIETERAAGLARSLLAWYDESKRDLPWRRAQDPYSIWISEIMAQQTRIGFLTPYYGRFTERFPTVASLAAANEAEVLKVWEGLGYYSRARNLHKAAQKIMSDFEGQMPRTKGELLSLPGIGEYTAGAVMSIAYGEPVPAVDGNVLRVFSRVENSDMDIALPQTRQTAAAFVESVMPPERAGCFTQALMELGALVCAPKSPDCLYCPVSELCRAYQCGRVHELPRKSPKKPQKVLDKTVLIIRNPHGEILMRRRTEKLLSGLWMPYMADGAMKDGADVQSHLRHLGYTVTDIRHIGPAKHVFTHLIWLMQGYDCRTGGEILPDGYRWIGREEVRMLATPAATRFYTEHIMKR